MRQYTILATFIIVSILFGACNHSPLHLGKPDVRPADQSVTETSTQTSSHTATQTVTATSAPTNTATATVTGSGTGTLTTTKTETELALTGEVVVDFTTAFHSAGPTVRARRGQKGVNFGTYSISNKTNRAVTAKQTSASFILSTYPLSNQYADGASQARIVTGAIASCQFRRWPDNQIYASSAAPTNEARIETHDAFEIGLGESIALDVNCDFVDQEPELWEIALAVQMVESDLTVTDSKGNRVSVSLGDKNGNPPKLAVLLSQSHCSAGKAVTIAKGIEPSIAGSDSGFGVAWKDNSLMPDVMNVAWFRAIDASGQALSLDSDILHAAADLTGWPMMVSSTSSGYLVNDQSVRYSNYSAFDRSGKRQFSANNLPLGNIIAGSDNASFTFLDQGEGYPALHEQKVVESGADDVQKYQWGPKTTWQVTNAVKGSGSWAFGAISDNSLKIAVVKDGSVLISAVPDVIIGGGGTSLGELIATDEGYVLSWFVSAGSRTFLSFVPTAGTTDGFVQRTVEVTDLAPEMYRIGHIAWNGRFIGYLSTSVSSGRSDFFLLEKSGKHIGPALSVAASIQGQWSEKRDSLAASKEAFGVAASSKADQTVSFIPISCI